MSDIVKTLRAAANHPHNEHGPTDWLTDAVNEIERLRKIIAACRWYWDADDPEWCFSDPWEAVDDLDEGDIREVWRGGKVETLFVARVGDDLVNEPTLEACRAKVAELKAKLWEEGVR